MQTIGSVAVEEHLHGGTRWVAVRARGAEWSWLTQDDAIQLAQHWMKAYGPTPGVTETVSSRGYNGRCSDDGSPTLK